VPLAAFEREAKDVMRVRRELHLDLVDAGRHVIGHVGAHHRPQVDRAAPRRLALRLERADRLDVRAQIGERGRPLGQIHDRAVVGADAEEHATRRDLVDSGDETPTASASRASETANATARGKHNRPRRAVVIPARV